MTTLTTEQLATYKLDRQAREQVRGGPLFRAVGIAILAAVAVAFLGAVGTFRGDVVFPAVGVAIVLAIAGGVYSSQRTISCSCCSSTMQKERHTPPRAHFELFSFSFTTSNLIQGTDRGRGAVYLLEQDLSAHSTNELRTYQVRGDYYLCHPCQRYVPTILQRKDIGGRKVLGERLEHHASMRRRRRSVARRGRRA